MQTLAVTLSYLIYDIVCCLFEDRISVDNTIHHLVGIIGISAGLHYQKVLFVFLFKLPNPLSLSLGKKWNIGCSNFVRSLTMRLATKSCVIFSYSSIMTMLFCSVAQSWWELFG